MNKTTQKLLLPALVTVFGISCSHLQSKNDIKRHVASADIDCTSDLNKCPPLFNIVQNDGHNVVIEFGDFSQIFGDKSGGYPLYFDIIYSGSKEDSVSREEEYNELVLKKIKIDKSNSNIDLISLFNENNKNKDPKNQKELRTGIYKFIIYKKDSDDPIWKQKVFVISRIESKLRKDLYLPKLTKQDAGNLARQYAPIVNLAQGEEYLPSKLEYLTNREDTNPDLDNEEFVLTNKSLLQSIGLGSENNFKIKFKFKDLTRILPFYGHSESVLKFSQNNINNSLMTERKTTRPFIYYSVIENPKLSEKEIYINYHLFYTFDPKGGKPGDPAFAAHIFDRESITVVLNRSKTPLRVHYGAHLAGQTMSQFTPDDKTLIQKWSSGRVAVNYPNQILKENTPPQFLVKTLDNTHPYAFAAQGSHGMYPIEGMYHVIYGEALEISVLREQAGSGRYLYPNDLGQNFVSQLPQNNSKEPNLAYELVDLNIDNLTSESIMAFSGSTVDVVGPTNATFPPFTDREEDFRYYNNVPGNNELELFDMTKENPGK